MEMYRNGELIMLHAGQEKPGLCPKPRPGQIISCVEACFGDGTCKGADKCCSNGCGHVCTKPLGMYLNY